MSDTAITETLGAKLRRLRTERGLTLQQLAHSAGGGLCFQTISHIERGLTHQPSFRTVCLLAAALGVSPNSLAAEATAE